MTILAIAAMFFIAVLLGVVAVYAGYYAVKTSPRHEIKKRLRKLAVNADKRVPKDLTVEILGEMTPVDRFLLRSSFMRKVDAMIDGAGLKMDIKIFAVLMLISALALSVLGMVVARSAIAAVVFFPLGALAPLLYLRWMKRKWIQKFTEQFPGALDMVSRSLKAGHSLTSAVQVVGSEMSEPMAGLFRAVYDEQTMGLSMKDSLAHMSERVDSVDFRFFVAAVNIHREIGGNLSEILERLSKTIRERITIRRQVKVYTAQARLSGYILAVLPVFVAAALYVLAPDYIGELVAVNAGKYAIAFAVTAQLIGFIVIKRIINIRI